MKTRTKQIITNIAIVAVGFAIGYTIGNLIFSQPVKQEAKVTFCPVPYVMQYCEANQLELQAKYGERL